MMKKSKFEIFISYRHKVSYDRAQLLLQLLEDNGYAGRVSFDCDNLEGQFNAEIISRVDKCTDFVMLVHSETFRNISSSSEDLHLYEQLMSCPEAAFNARMKQLKDQNIYVDYVRVELGRALNKHKNIIPVVPTNTEVFCFDTLKLPSDISGITGYQAVYFNDSSSLLFKDIMPRLLPKLKTQVCRPHGKLLKILISFIVLTVIGVLSIYTQKYFTERSEFRQCRTYKDYIAFQNDSNHNIFFVDACRDSARLFEILYNHGYAYINNNGGNDSISVFWNDNLSLLQLSVLRGMLDSMMYVKVGTFIMGTDQFLGGTGFFCGRALTIANLKTCVRRYILSPKDSTFASMNQNNDIDMYKGLAVYFLPEGVLNYFDVVAFAEEPPKKNDVLYSSELHIYLDEKDNRTSDMQGSKSKGYTEDKQILDFPVRGRKAVIHIRRKRWLMPDGSCQVVDLHKKVEIEYKGTRYSKEFALFLKMATGQ
jgi:hypothetical protein